MKSVLTLIKPSVDKVGRSAETMKRWGRRQMSMHVKQRVWSSKVES